MLWECSKCHLSSHTSHTGEHILLRLLFRSTPTVCTMSEKAPLRVVITGAAGQIAYSLIYQVASGYVFGPDQVRSELDGRLNVFNLISL